MGVWVQKFGGTSVASIERIQCTAKIIAAAYEAGHKVIAVVSAMGGETNNLIQLANQISTKPNSREYDALLATGEQISASLLSMCLQEMGYKSHSYNSLQIPINTTDDQGNAHITDIASENLLKQINGGVIPVVTGFQGVGSERQTTTLGRGGSDMTAVAVAAAVEADECQIYTDVDGIYSSDPRIVPNTHKLDIISGNHMLELARAGAQVMQQQAMLYALKHNISLRVLSSFNLGQGTLICHSDQDPRLAEAATQQQVLGIAIALNQCHLQLEYASQQQQQVKQLVAQLQTNINIYPFATESINNKTQTITSHYCIDSCDLGELTQQLNTLFIQHQQNPPKITHNTNMGKLTFIGNNLLDSNLQQQLDQRLMQHNIHGETIKSNAQLIALLIPIEDIETAAYHLHRNFVERQLPQT